MVWKLAMLQIKLESFQNSLVFSIPFKNFEIIWDKNLSVSLLDS
jgi:hypothetical protein